jgi:hypothetical protein
MPAVTLMIIVSVYALTLPTLFDNTTNATSITTSVLSTTQQESQQNPISTTENRQVTLVAVVDDQGDPPRLMDWLFRPAMEELKNRHPDLNITLDYRPEPT